MKNYYKGLDGIRAISIIMVIIDHLGLFTILPEAFNRILDRLIDGGSGVKIFFVISGFLITSLLITEKKKKGHIFFKKFFLKKFFKIF